MSLQATTSQTVGPFLHIGLTWLVTDNLAGPGVAGAGIGHLRTASSNLHQRYGIFDATDREGDTMNGRRTIATLGGAALLVGALAWSASAGGAHASATAAPCTILDPTGFVATIDNPYYPLPVGRTLVYRGVRDGQTQGDRVTVTSETKVIGGVTATVVRDIAKHGSTLLEKTTDWYAQDTQGNVCYLGEDTKAYLPNGQVDPSGSWEAGVNGAVSGIIMEADPQIPDSYRQEYLAGEAEDTAWIVGLHGTATVPYGTVHNVLTSLEHTALEPDVVDKKVYAPGLGIVLEQALAGGQEVAKLVRVTG